MLQHPRLKEDYRTLLCEGRGVLLLSDAGDALLPAGLYERLVPLLDGLTSTEQLTRHLERDWRPMQAYNEYTANTSFHSVTEKKFWATTIPAQAKSDTEGDFKIAIDTVFNHPNVAPFITKQLIQRVVTSNPSPGYVYRVARAFDGYRGTDPDGSPSAPRGDLGAVVRAILTDYEARSTTFLNTPGYGKLRLYHIAARFLEEDGHD